MMSNPAPRARLAAATHSPCARRMSASSIVFGTTTLSRSLLICDGASCGSRGQRAVLVRAVGHHPKRPHVLVVPQPGRHVRRLVRLGADRAVLGADRRPAALRLHPAEGGLRPGLLDPEAGAVRYLVEPVAQRLWPDPDRFEQDVVTLLPAHQRAASISARRRCMYSCSSSSTAGSMPGSS